MAKTVNEAFEIFLKDYVNLDPYETKKARSSRDWLISQIILFPTKDIYFPTLYSEKNIFFGSFARRTKKRILDDIDLMIALNANGATYYEYQNNKVQIHVHDSSSKLKRLCTDNTNILNSRKVINKFVNLLFQIPQYQEAGITRNMEVAKLKLKSYSWYFDIVPCFFTQQNLFGNDYYLIPDGNGDWKKTDPRIDRDRVIRINQFHDGNVLNLIRVMKYWNKRSTMPSMPSYLIENMILDFYFSKSEKASKYVNLELPDLFKYIENQIFYPVNDPKNIQGNINNLSWNEKLKISSRACIDHQKSLEARKFENEGNHMLSIIKWGEVFGSNFPTYSFFS